MKFAFIGSTIFCIYLIKYHKVYKHTYDAENADNFPHFKYCLPIAAVLTLFIHTNFWNVFELMWSYSIWLEAIAIFPQIRIITKMKGIESSLTGDYVACLGMYRVFYIFFWYFI